MINWLDILILIIIVFSAVRGGMVGFIRSVVGLISLIIAFFSANIYYDNLASLIVEQSVVKDGLKGFFSKDIFSQFKIPSIDFSQQLSGFGDVEKYLDKLFVRSKFITDAMAVDFSEFMAQIIVNIIAWLAVFLVAFLIVRLIGVVLEEVFKLPLLKSINAIAGFAIGIVKGSLTVFLIIIVLQFLGHISQTGQLSKVVENSVFAFYILKYNVFRLFII
jgi:uncharacterized membrane protein required for colicin V production